MLARTHLAIGAFLVILLLPHITYKWVYIPIVIIASLLPDIDTGFSTLGRKAYFRPVQWFTRHRGIWHSFTLCLLISLVLAAFVPVMALPFFLGYGFHLFADMFTIEGIRPFWPWSGESKGKIRTGGTIEKAIFVVFLIVDAALLVSWFI